MNIKKRSERSEKLFNYIVLVEKYGKTDRISCISRNTDGNLSIAVDGFGFHGPVSL